MSHLHKYKLRREEFHYPQSEEIGTQRLRIGNRCEVIGKPSIEPKWAHLHQTLLAWMLMQCDFIFLENFLPR